MLFTVSLFLLCSASILTSPALAEFFFFSVTGCRFFVCPGIYFTFNYVIQPSHFMSPTLSDLFILSSVQSLGVYTARVRRIKRGTYFPYVVVSIKGMHNVLFQFLLFPTQPCRTYWYPPRGPRNSRVCIKRVTGFGLRCSDVRFRSNCILHVNSDQSILGSVS